MPKPNDAAETTGLQPWQRPPFEPGHLLSTKHGAYSPRKVGERADIVRAELLTQRPDLALDPECAQPLALYCRSVAREELGHQAIEAGTLNARLLESVSAAARVARELGDALGIGPRAAAELREVRSRAALNVATLARETPLVLGAMEAALASLGLAARLEEFRQALGAQLAEIAGD